MLAAEEVVATLLKSQQWVDSVFFLSFFPSLSQKNIFLSPLPHALALFSLAPFPRNLVHGQTENDTGK